MQGPPAVVGRWCWRRAKIAARAVRGAAGGGPGAAEGRRVPPGLRPSPTRPALPCPTPPLPTPPPTLAPATSPPRPRPARPRPSAFSGPFAADGSNNTPGPVLLTSASSAIMECFMPYVLQIPRADARPPSPPPPLFHTGLSHGLTTTRPRFLQGLARAEPARGGVEGGGW
jgi:hypothetical protein